MKTVVLALSLAFAGSFLTLTAASAGSCDHSWQTASDGSHCGGRAADQRDGGK